MKRDWYYLAKDKEKGPFSRTQLAALVTKDMVTRDTLVKQGINGEWIAASSVPNLFNLEIPTNPKGEPLRDDDILAILEAPSPPKPARPKPPPRPTLLPCLDCSKPVSTLAPFCPNCGRPSPHAPVAQTLETKEETAEERYQAWKAKENLKFYENQRKQLGLAKQVEDDESDPELKAAREQWKQAAEGLTRYGQSMQVVGVLITVICLALLFLLLLSSL